MCALPNMAVVRDITELAIACGTGPYGWYAGIATDPMQRLFDDHRVDASTKDWIWWEAPSEAVARATEKALLDNGFRGGPGGGREPRFVYAYKITDYTSED